MGSNRRQFISTAVTGGLAAAIPVSSFGQGDSDRHPLPLEEKYEKLDQILKQAVLRGNPSDS